MIKNSYLILPEIYFIKYNELIDLKINSLKKIKKQNKQIQKKQKLKQTNSTFKPLL